MTVANICCRAVDQAKAFESVQVAAQRMNDRKVGTLVVVNDVQTPIGMMTDRDLAVRVVAEGRDPNSTNVHDIMTTYVEQVGEDCSIEDALEIMRRGPYRRLLVVGQQQQLVGIVSIDDILIHLSEEFRGIGELLLRESPESLASAKSK